MKVLLGNMFIQHQRSWRYIYINIPDMILRILIQIFIHHDKIFQITVLIQSGVKIIYSDEHHFFTTPISPRGIQLSLKGATTKN